MSEGSEQIDIVQNGFCRCYRYLAVLRCNRDFLISVIYRSRLALYLITLAIVFCASSIAYANRAVEEDIASILGWKKDDSGLNFCGGYFEEAKNLLPYKKLSESLASKIAIKARREAIFAEYGSSVLSGNVTISQPERVIAANKVTIWRDQRSGKITNINLLGDIELQEYGKLILARDGEIDFFQKTIELNDAIYRITVPNEKTPMSSWGQAKTVFYDAFGVFRFDHASYSSCPPENSFWHILSKKLILNRERGRGVAKNSFLYFRKFPIFYFPYLNFPIDSRRQSGFLYPTIANVSYSGITFAWPYYFNLAPNYDLTFTPEFLSKRGIFFDFLFRYLTMHRKGDLEFGYIPYDRAFVDWRDKAPLQYPKDRSLARLLDSKSYRGFFSLSEKIRYSQNWHGNLILNYVSDDYFLRDFKYLSSENQDQLLNQAEIIYRGQYWCFHGLLQAFQTLHPVTYKGNSNQYLRLPQLGFDGDYSDRLFGVNFKITSQFTHFDHAKEFDSLKPVVTGERFFIVPSISWPKRTTSAYLIPKINLFVRQYLLKNRELNKPTAINSVIPSFSFDSGLFFKRAISLFRKHYQQTLEPRFYYLYIPYHDQSEFPVFDTTIPAFSFETFFRGNRFSGIDRIGDANQVTLALTTRLLEDYTGAEKINLSIGQVYLFRQYDVCFSKSCSSDFPIPDRFSPVVTRLQYSLNRFWDMSLDATWDPSINLLNNSSFNIHYHFDGRKIVNFRYNFVKKSDFFQGSVKNLDRIELSFVWPLTQHWRILGNWHYNASYIYPENYFYGLEYEGCCFAARVIQGRDFLGVDANSNPLFENQIFLQFLFKGLGAIERGGTEEVVRRITNYQDNFTTRFYL